MTLDRHFCICTLNLYLHTSFVSTHWLCVSTHWIRVVSGLRSHSHTPVFPSSPKCRYHRWLAKDPTPGVFKGSQTKSWDREIRIEWGLRTNEVSVDSLRKKKKWNPIGHNQGQQMLVLRTLQVYIGCVFDFITEYCIRLIRLIKRLLRWFSNYVRSRTSTPSK